MGKETFIKQKQCFQIDLEETSLQDLKAMSFNEVTSLSVTIPLPSVGRTNSHVDICSDLLDASYIAEELAKHAQNVSAENIYNREQHKTAVKLSIECPAPSIKDELVKSATLLICHQDNFEEFKTEYEDLRQKVYDYEDIVDTYDPQVPEVLEWYFENLINGANYEIRGEAPDYYKEQIALYPERRVSFHKSAFSSRIGSDSYASQDGWLVSSNIKLDHFFKTTDQAFRLKEFISGSVFTLEGKSFVRTDEQIVYFPMNQYFKSRVCASLVLSEDEDTWPSDPFDWTDAAFTHSPYGELMRSAISGSIRTPDPRKEKCTVHESGSLICIDDGQFFHLLYDTKPLNIHETKRIYDHVSTLTGNIATNIGLSENITCDWKSIADEAFENLCYDIIYIHPKFDPETIRKLGKSRSRDGGRDIIVYENRKITGEKPKKWIFQCKLITDDSSLTGRKLTDVGDMLDQYEAEGFGVLTSSFIDSTLYDKLEKICRKRKIKELHYSVFELERYLARHPSIKNRYFK